MIDPDLTDAEQLMIEMLRHDKHLTVTISRDGDNWHMRLEDHDQGTVSDGHGPSFDRAWDDITPAHWRSRLKR
jgi:hypothetical protein